MGQLHTYFGSEGAGRELGGNLAGIRDPVVDTLIEIAQGAPDIETATIACRALDRGPDVGLLSCSPEHDRG